MPKITKLFIPDSLAINAELKIPLVYTKVIEDEVEVYHGFVPGLTLKDSVATSLEACKELLQENVNVIIDKYLDDKKPFPFFPEKEQIINDFEGVCHISYIKI